MPVDEYVDALRRELSLRHGAEHLTLDTLYLGGGTPSRLGGEGVARTLAAIAEHSELAPRAEVTLEANPEDVTAEALDGWLVAGVNRLSIGSQTFSDAALGWMHRTHSAGRIDEAVHLARAAGFTNYSLDLIFALPGAVSRSWPDDLERALALEPAHLSLYGLTVEPATPLGRWHARGQSEEAGEDRYEEEFLRANERLSAGGFEHYEVSNFARPGLASRHNSSYWRGVPYAAVGPSAHAFDGLRRRWNVAPYAEWVRRLREAKDPSGGEELLSGENRIAEDVYLGLRTTAGLALANDGERSLVAPWVQAGWATIDDAARTVRLTPLGWLRLDALAAVLTHSRSR